MSHLRQNYCYFLNGPDNHNPELPLKNSKAVGGTMVIWKRKFDPFMTPRSVSSSSFLPVVLHPPGFLPTIHVCIYLPTYGREKEFLHEFSSLISTIEDLMAEFPDSPLYLRGDFNVSGNHLKRSELLKGFLEDLDLVELPQQHPTYHHFTGNGQSDSF